MYVCIYIFIIHIYMYVCIYIFIIHIYIYTYIYIYIYIYLYIYIRHILKYNIIFETFVFKILIYSCRRCTSASRAMRFSNIIDELLIIYSIIHELYIFLGWEALHFCLAGDALFYSLTPSDSQPRGILYLGTQLPRFIRTKVQILTGKALLYIYTYM